VLKKKDKSKLVALMSQCSPSGWSKSPFFLRVATVFVATAGLCAPTFASLGEARLQSALGQQLRAQIPTVGLEIDQLEPRCLRLFRPSSNAGVPIPQDIFLEFQDFGSSRRVTARTRTAVQEPAIRFGVELTCGQSVKREYILLLDPQPVGDTTALPNPPIIEGAPIGEPPVVIGRPTSRNDVLSTDPSVGGENRPARAVVRRRPTPVAQGSIEPPPRKVREAAAKLSIRGSADSLTRDLDLTAFASPRLRLSQALTLGGIGVAPGSDVDRAVMASKRARLLSTPIESDLRPQLEVDLMIAQKRIAELQARIAAADPKAPSATPSLPATEPAKVSAAMSAPLIEPPPAPTPQTPTVPKVVSREKQAASGSDTPLLIAAVSGLGALALGGALLWLRKKRREEEQERSYAAAAAAVGLSPDLSGDQAMGGFVDTRRGMASRGASRAAKPRAKPDLDNTVRNVVASMESNSGEEVGPSQGGLTTVKVHGDNPLGPLDLTSDLFQPSFDTEKLGVSVVSAVTEEASVYVELNRVTEAINVLRDHIDLERAYNRATPAPWLMLLDLYHREDNRPDFEVLRTNFIKNFNGRIPEWGAFNELGNDKSLLEHEHIVERLVRYWSTPQCHQYIQKLLYDHRDNSRIGFSLMAYRELVLLDMVHSSAFPSEDIEHVVIPDA
jgi:pilus assembly protein FimV